MITSSQTCLIFITEKEEEEIYIYICWILFLLFLWVIVQTSIYGFASDQISPQSTTRNVDELTEKTSQPAQIKPTQLKYPKW